MSEFKTTAGGTSSVSKKTHFDRIVLDPAYIPEIPQSLTVKLKVSRAQCSFHWLNVDLAHESVTVLQRKVMYSSTCLYKYTHTLYTCCTNNDRRCVQVDIEQSVPAETLSAFFTHDQQSRKCD